MTIQRYFIEISYQGTHYSGWQIQKNGISIQQKLNEALSTILNSEIIIQGASRTDAGVHAKQNFAHFDTSVIIPKNFISRINLILPKDVSVKKIIPVKKDAHVRFDAATRSYEYYIHFEKNPFLRVLSYYYPYGKLNTNKMNESAKLLLRYKDFSAFSKLHTQVKNNDCKIYESIWKRNSKTNQLVFYIRANRFLRGMVRGIVGTSIQVGNGKISVTDFKKIIESKDQSKADFSAPPEGLYLSSIQYPYL